MALVELYRETHDTKYLDLAQFFVEQRGRGVLRNLENLQDHLPIRQQTYMTGHAVRQLYLCSGVTDIYAERGDNTLLDTLEKQHKDFVNSKMYITGGAGARHEGEAFGLPFELPNETAYAETCAAIASFMWNWRMLLISGDARFADEMERALYNNILSGVSLDGKEYFYVNPLKNNGEHRRTTKHFDGCACCPPNIARLFASLPGYLYGVSKHGDIFIHHFASSRAELRTKDTNVILEQETDYPWSGKIILYLYPKTKCRFVLNIRHPGWAERVQIKCNGKTVVPKTSPGKYIPVERAWKYGDKIELEFPMRVERIVSDIRVAENIGQVALRRGPVVYCIEQTDQREVDLSTIQIAANPAFGVITAPDLLGGVNIIEFDAVVPATQENPLYYDFDSPQIRYRTVRIRAIPYYAWANRDPGPMRVWIPQAHF